MLPSGGATPIKASFAGEPSAASLVELQLGQEFHGAFDHQIAAAFAGLGLF